MHETHPGYKETYSKGCFSIKRTNKPFSRTAVDLTLEQTINADTANRYVGIACFTNNLSARQRWAQNHFIRTSITSYYSLEKLGIQNQEDTTKELKPHRVTKDNADLNLLTAGIKNFVNPFSEVIPSDQLINIATGKSCSHEIESFLLNVVTTGKTARDNFVTECSIDEVRFEKPMKRIKVKTFANQGVKFSVKQKETVSEIKLERDLISKILLLAIDKNIDLQLVLHYPLTPVPMPLCNIDGSSDGSMIKTDKSALLKLLQNYDS